MTFTEAMDELGLSAAELGELLDRPAQSIRQMRLDPSHRNYRPPPDHWQAKLARIAEQRGKAFARLAERLRDEAGEGA